MKTKLAIALLVACASLAPMMSHAEDADQDRSHPKAFVKDSGITAKIKTRLAKEAPSSLGRIHVDTDTNGVVTLSGYAHSQAEMDRAMSIARGTEHVVDVKNDLTIKQDD